MRVELLYFQGCAHHGATVERVREVLAREGVRAEVREIWVRDAEDAARLRFLGSPTVRIDGIDVEPGANEREHGGVACRWYGDSGIPSQELLRAAIRSRRPAK